MKKRTPTIYLASIFLLIIYGVGANILVYVMKDPSALSMLSNINVTVTLFWLFFNIFLLFFFMIYRYEGQAFLFAAYYTCIGLFFVSELLFKYVQNTTLLFGISIGTKVIGGTAAFILLRRNLKGRMFLGKL